MIFAAVEIDRTTTPDVLLCPFQACIIHFCDFFILWDAAFSGPFSLSGTYQQYQVQNGRDNDQRSNNQKKYSNSYQNSNPDIHPFSSLFY